MGVTEEKDGTRSGGKSVGRDRLAFERQIQRHFGPLKPSAEVSPRQPRLHTHTRTYSRAYLHTCIHLYICTYYHPCRCATTRLMEEGRLQLCVSGNQRNRPGARLGPGFRKQGALVTVDLLKSSTPTPFRTPTNRYYQFCACERESRTRTAITPTSTGSNPFPPPLYDTVTMRVYRVFQ